MLLSRKIAAASLAALALATAASAGPNITWVPPYSIPQCKAMVNRDFGGIGMKDGLTFLALQLWVCDGPNVKPWNTSAGTTFDNNVKFFRDWGKANGVKVTLCVVNHVGGWNWAEARRSFIDNRVAFVRSIVNEIERLGLDGVELDLEGPVTPTANDSIQYMTMVRELGAALHPLNKTVTVASYTAQYNAPNWKWWPELMKTCAGVTSMGYDDAGMNNPAGWKYPEQIKRANPVNKLMIGMFGGSGSWQGNTAAQHIDWVVQNGQAGIGIWDAALGNGTWESAATWQKLKTIKGNTPSHLLNPRMRVEGTIGAQLSVRPAGDGLMADLALPSRSDVRVKVFNLQGGEVAELYNGKGEAGTLSLQVPASRVTAGSYLLAATVDGKTSTERITVSR
jgi:hypothetical protein